MTWIRCPKFPNKKGVWSFESLRFLASTCSRLKGSKLMGCPGFQMVWKDALSCWKGLSTSDEETKNMNSLTYWQSHDLSKISSSHIENVAISFGRPSPIGRLFASAMSNTMISVRTSGSRVVPRDMGLGYERIHGHRRGFQTSLDFLIVSYSLTFRSTFVLTCLRDLQLCNPGNIFEAPSYLNRC